MTAEVYNVLGQNNAPVLPANAQPILVTQVPNVDFDWGGGQVLNSGRYEDVIVKFTGNFTPISTGTTYITAPADDGVRLYLDGQLYINDWYDKGGGGSTADVPTTQAVPMVIEMWYYENGGGANVKLLWFTDNGWEVIPASAFVAPVPVVVPEPEPTPEPTPSVSPTPEPEPVPVEPVPVPEEPVVVPVEPEVIPVPEPQPVPQPVPVVPPVAPPVEEPAPVEPEPIPLPAPEPEPEPQPEPPAVEPTPEPVQPEPPIEEPESPIVQAEDTDLESLEPDTPVELSNGVVVTAEVAIAVQLLQDPAAMLQEIFTDPGAALAALGSVGADMTEEVREKSEKVIVAAVIAGNIATTASISAASAGAGYRRKP